MALSTKMIGFLSIFVWFSIPVEPTQFKRVEHEHFPYLFISLANKHPTISTAKAGKLNCPLSNLFPLEKTKKKPQVVAPLVVNFCDYILMCVHVNER